MAAGLKSECPLPILRHTHSLCLFPHLSSSPSKLYHPISILLPIPTTGSSPFTLSSPLNEHSLVLMHHQAVILLAFVLALGFLLVILSCALWANWLPLLVGQSIS